MVELGKAQKPPWSNPLWKLAFREALQEGKHTFEVDDVKYKFYISKTNSKYFVMTGSNGTVGQVERERPLRAGVDW